MKTESSRAAVAAGPEIERRVYTWARAAHRNIDLAAVVAVAFALYWCSSITIEASNATTHFGSDAPLYALLAQGSAADRVTRFHPVTVVMALGWMKIFSPLAPWISSDHLLKAMFAAVGAGGVWAVMSAFSAVVPRRHVALWGCIYAASFGVWFFSSIEESKIVSATLSAIYIAAYFRLREDWTLRGALILTTILLVACLNEIVACFLVLIPAIDVLVQRGFDLRYGRWIVWHALAAPTAFAFLEGVVNGPLLAPSTDPEGASHFSMLLFYLDDANLSPWSIYYFLVNWLFFNFAAPSPALSHVFTRWPNNKYFDPVLANYFSSPVTMCLVVLFAVMLVASILPWNRTERSGHLGAIFWAVLAYALARGAFFLVVHPYECLLFTSSVTAAHMLLIGIPFTSSGFQPKRGLLAALAVLLFITNGTFIISQ